MLKVFAVTLAILGVVSSSAAGTWRCKDPEFVLQKFTLDEHSNLVSVDKVLNHVSVTKNRGIVTIGQNHYNVGVDLRGNPLLTLLNTQKGVRQQFTRE